MPHIQLEVNGVSETATTPNELFDYINTPHSDVWIILPDGDHSVVDMISDTTNRKEVKQFFKDYANEETVDSEYDLYKKYGIKPSYFS